MPVYPAGTSFARTIQRLLGDDTVDVEIYRFHQSLISKALVSARAGRKVLIISSVPKADCLDIGEAAVLLDLPNVGFVSGFPLTGELLAKAIENLGPSPKNEGSD